MSRSKTDRPSRLLLTSAAVTATAVAGGLGTDRAAAVLLTPYAGWVAFATALNVAIARRNPQGHP
jgi:tryptophan-rich sensory protein